MLCNIFHTTIREINNFFSKYFFLYSAVMQDIYLLMTIAVITGSHPEWRTVLVAGCLAAITIHIGVRAKKKAPTKGDI